MPSLKSVYNKLHSATQQIVINLIANRYDQMRGNCGDAVREFSNFGFINFDMIFEIRPESIKLKHGAIIIVRTIPAHLASLTFIIVQFLFTEICFFDIQFIDINIKYG